jgi:hypothetical protein
MSPKKLRVGESGAHTWFVESVARLAEQEPFKLLAAGSSPSRPIASAGPMRLHQVPEN